jgi:citronellol/citronellal dehydrogenase
MLAPPLNLHPKWFKNHVAYTMAKYGMSMCVLGMSEEFRGDGIAVNALWPRTVIGTAALQLIPGVKPEMGRTPDILADAAYCIFNRDSRRCSGHFFIDEDVLREEGVSDLSPYSIEPGRRDFAPDLFLD